MNTRAPFSFLLVENAATCASGYPSYRQIWEEVCNNQLMFDPAQVHEGVWLLDAAIAARLKSSGGLREFSRHRGADPAMDELWASWVNVCPHSVIGDGDVQCQRIASLIKLGSSQCLSALLALYPQKMESIQAQWSKDNIAYLSKPFFNYVLSEDLIGTLGTLLGSGILPDSSKAKGHPLTQVKSAQCASLLLESGVSVACFPGQELLSLTSSRDLPAKSIGEIMQAIISHSPIVDTPEASASRMAQGLSHKTAEQFQIEARNAGWSPSFRPQGFSPARAWAQEFIGNSSSNFVEGGALSWLRRQPSHGRCLSGETHSDASWTWACMFPHNPGHAQRHAEVAQDMEQGLPSWARLQDFHRRLQDAGALTDGCFEKAIVRLIMEQHYQRNQEQYPKFMWEGWFSEKNGKTWVLDAIRHNPRCTLQLNVVLECGEVNGFQGHALALALMLAGVCKEKDIIDKSVEVWNRGVRPAIREGDANRLVELVDPLNAEYSAMIQAWCLNEFSAPNITTSRHFRL
jgi:hypothetical protein